MTIFPRSEGEQCRHRDTFLRRHTATHEHIEEIRRNLLIQRTRITNRSVAGHVFQFPAETMAEIFLYSQLASYDSKGSRYKHEDWCWLTITHVCKYWRDIAVGTQQLWEYIDTGRHASAEQTAVYLERSGTFPLVVIYARDFLNEKVDVCLPRFLLALQQFHRIRELHINRSPLPAQIEELWTVLIQNPAPVLKSFSLFIKLKESFDFNALFTGYTPQLKTLALRVDLSWYAVPIVRNLKHFLVSPSLITFNLQEALLILQENTNIESFKISSPIKRGAPHLNGSHTMTSPIRLPCLNDLMIECVHFEHLRSFLQYVELPESISWDIYCVDYPIRRQQDANPKLIIPRVCSNSKCMNLELALCASFAQINAENENATEKHHQKHSSHCFITYSWENEAKLFEELGTMVTVAESMSFVCSVIKDGFWCSTTILTVDLEGCNTCRDDLSVTDKLGYLHWIQLLKLLPELEELTVRQPLIVDDRFGDIIDEAHFGISWYAHG